MKIEKINDNQIRCTLTRDDLATHQIKFSELTYGTEKAKNLFRSMMQQANHEFGFEIDNTPLMIEAIPLASESIVLIITKVDDPEELDTRFSKFAPDNDRPQDPSTHAPLTGADDVLELFQKLCETKSKENPELKEGDVEGSINVQDTSVNLLRIFSFKNLDDVIAPSGAISCFYGGKNSLYKTSDDTYELVLHKSGSTPENFNKVCNILSEYGKIRAFSPSGEAHLEEHGQSILRTNALKQLAALS